MNDPKKPEAAAIEAAFAEVRRKYAGRGCVGVPESLPPFIRRRP